MAAGIVIPARDEAENIETAVAAIGRAVASLASTRRVAVCIVDDASSDATAEVARRALADLGVPSVVLSADHHDVALARRAGVEAVAALLGFGPGPSEVGMMVLSTDADTSVRSCWIRRVLDHADRGATAIAGVVDLVEDRESADLIDRWRNDYGRTIAPDGTHPHVHAANLAVRLDVYRAAGGFQSNVTAEDRDLWQRIRALGHHPVADASLVVDTSARSVARVDAAFGFGSALNHRYRLEAPVHSAVDACHEPG